jgi:Flp pilus assembly protein TadG
MGRRRHEDGAAAVEFALVLPFFMFLVMGIIQYGFYFWTAETTNSAAREAARRVVVGDCWDSTKMENYVRSQAPHMSGATRSATPSTLSVGSPITITVTADADILDFLPMPNSGAITREYVARMEVSSQSTTANDTCAAY